MDNKETISSLTATITASFEKKKTEITTTRGAIDGLRELQKTHADFVEKSKSELKALIAEGKLSQEIVNFVMSWLGKSSKVISDFSVAVKTNHDSKTGEAVSLNNVLQLLKQAEKSPAPPPPPSIPPPPPVEDLPPSSVKEEKRSYKSRLKKNDTMAKTVERLKKSRSKKSEVASENQ